MRHAPSNLKIVQLWFGLLVVILLCFQIRVRGQNHANPDKGKNRVIWVVDGSRSNIPGPLKKTIQNDSLWSNESALKAKILEFYYGRGYLAANIDSINVSSQKSRKSGYVSIGTGCKYTLSSVEFKRLPNQSDAVLNGSFLQKGVEFNKTLVEREINRIINIYEKKGYPLVKVNLADIERIPEGCEVNINIQVDVGRQMRVDGLMLPSLKNVDNGYIRKASGVSDSALITPDLLHSTRKRLQNTGYFKRVGKPEIVVRNNRDYLQFPLEERNPNHFDLVIGYIPNSPNGGTLAGDGQLKIRNIFWPGSTTYLEFERQRQLVSKLDFGFGRDWILGIPLGAGIDFHFLQQDTSYQVRDFSFTGSYALNSNLDLKGKLRRKVAVGNQNLQNTVDVLDAEGIYGGLGFEFHQLDDRLNPSRGIKLSADLQTGVKTVTDSRTSSESISRRVSQRFLEFDIQPYIPTFHRQVLTVRLHGFLLDAVQMTESDLTRFGGSGSLRGYREDQFRASRLIWGDVEYRYLLDPATYGFVFGAVGSYHRPRLVTESNNERQVTDLLYSWGLGFSYNTRIGRLKFSYAVSPEDAINNGKVHFGIIADL